MSFLTDIEAKYEVDEQWVVTQINTAWQEVEKVEAWADAEAPIISSWLDAHQQTLLGLFTTAAGLLPELTPEAAIATTALDAATAAADAVTAGLKAGTIPASVIANGYATAKTAASAVNAVLQQAAAKPATPVAATAGS